MRILSFIIWYFVISFIGMFSKESPHGKDFKISCNTCHSSKNWSLDKEIYNFDHSTTKMPLIGQHKEVNCRLCHPTLVFSEAKSKTECVNCHTDIHSQSVGNYCDKCHTPNSWLVNNVTAIHQQSRFPLLGVHTITECQKCHKSESLHRFDVQGVECIDCHRDNYQSTTSPNHNSSNISTECAQCHNIYSYDWGGNGFNHSIFPLTQGHSGVECSKCHINNNYTNLSTDCYSCHKTNYDATTNPIHTGCFSTNCASCHTTSPGWRPVNYVHQFPLTNGHSNIACNSCHTNGSNCNLSTDCYSCHRPNYEAARNPVHTGGCFSTNCISCHTTNIGWRPVNYVHQFPLTLGHSNVACNQCHINGVNCNISTDCYSCHRPDYEAATNPVHNAGCYPTTCTTCHTTNPGWQPVSFQHNNYFPISSGRHSGFSCSQCHTNPSNCTFSCIDCHTHSQAESNGNHSGISGYSWVSSACYNCHPRGSAK